DEPSFTQPQLYAKIEQRKPVRDGYLEHLLKLGEVTREEADQIALKQQELLEKNLSEARSSSKGMLPSTLDRIWKGYVGGDEPADDNPDTGLAKEKLSGLLEKLCVIPKDFTLHPKLEKFMENRRRMARGEVALDWSAGEVLAFASLSTEGHRVRLSGQDSERGTFSHRHAVLHDYQTGARHMPLRHLSEKQAPIDIYNSPISEAGVLGFEYGYSLDYPDGLTLWEAQFGDFVNVAQVILDQFITSGEDKWRRLSGLVLLLPHGFEGSGPEHSSGRPERFLAQAAENNIQVTIPTTPAQYFHLLRRQMLRRWRKPLIVYTPKGLLRDARAVSTLADCSKGRFQPVIADPRGVSLKNIKRVLLCSGKIYYDLETERAKLKRDDVAIIRLEQLYPFPQAELEAALAGCREDVSVLWVQDEPENMGAWRYLRVTDAIPLPCDGICRPASASPATGSHAAHLLEQEELFKRAFQMDKPVARPGKNGSNKRQLANQL
ncbi:MAG: 2-oxoglutarate dehydrogenase E1 component, partial [Verrucomicrobia bacterium]|nr:2-oxoglutarate dehydrogenase E1 component [Verrucomicrobiota bacterium]